MTTNHTAGTRLLVSATESSKDGYNIVQVAKGLAFGTFADSRPLTVDEYFEIVRKVEFHAELLAALEELVLRCDGAEGVRSDGSNIQTMRAHAVLARAKGE